MNDSVKSDAVAFLRQISTDVSDDESRRVFEVALSMVDSPRMAANVMDTLGPWLASELDIHARTDDLPVM